VQDFFFAPGVHSRDPTGPETESDIPTYAKLFDEYFQWKSSNTATSGNGRPDRQLRDERRMRAQSFVGAQAPLGTQGQTLRTEVTQANRNSVQHLASASLGPEIRERSRSLVPPVAGMATRRPPRNTRSPVNVPVHSDLFAQTDTNGLGSIITTVMQNLHPPTNEVASNIESILRLRDMRDKAKPDQDFILEAYASRMLLQLTGIEAPAV